MRSAAWVKALGITLRRFARRAVMVAGCAVIAVLLIVCGLLAYLHTAGGRGFLAAKVNALVSRELVAELRIERIEVLANDRLVISGATLFDTSGRAVLRVRGVSARLDAWTLLKNAVAEPTARIELPKLHVERLEIGLFRTPTGGLSLSDALQSRVPSPTPAKPAKGPRIQLPQIAIDSVSARTDLNGLAQASAELHGLQGNFDWSPEQLSLGLESADVRVLRALPLDGQARLHAQIRVPGTTLVTLDGSLGDLPIHASFRQSGDELGLSLSSASLTPVSMRRLLPAWPLSLPASVQAELSGQLAAMQARAEVQAGVSRLEATGTVALSPSIKGELSVLGRELDVRLFAPELARSALGVDAKLAFSFDPATHVDLTAHFAKTDWSGAPLPTTSVHAVYAANHVTGTVASSDPTLPVSVDFGVSEQGALTFHARAQNLDLTALAPYGLSARGQLDWDASGELLQDQLVVECEARIRALSLAAVRAQSIVVHGKIHGSTARPEQLGVELRVEGTTFALGPAKFPVWALESKGSLERQLVSLRAGPAAGPQLQASTTLAFEQGVSLSDTQVEAELNGVKHRLELKSARFAAEALVLRELRWQVGAGLLAGSVLISKARKQVELELSGLSAEALSQTLGLGANAVRGRLNAHFQFQEDGRVRQGQLQGSVVDGAVPEVGALQAEFNATVAGSELEGHAALAAPELGQGKLSLRASLGKGPITPDSLASMRGEARLDISDVELREVTRRWLPSASIALSGRVDGSVRLAKLNPSAPATISYDLKTRELGLHSSRSDGEGSLLHAELASHGEIGTTETAVQLELKDAAGTWISAHAEQRVGWPDLVRVVRSSSPALLLDAPVHVVIKALPRSLQLLGAATPLASNGEVSANFNVTGTPRHPEIEGTLNGTDLGRGLKPSGNLALSIDYSSEREEYSFTGRYADRGRGKLEIGGGGHWGWFDRGFGRDWSVRAQGRIEQVALGAIGDLLGVPVSGNAAGHGVVTASASQLEATGELNLDNLALERHALGRGKVELRVHRGLAEGQLSIVGSKATLDLSGEVGLCWDGAPCIDPKRGGKLDAKLRNYQLATLAPLLRSVVSDVRGPIDGFIALHWDPADATGKRKTRLRADASVSGGSLTLSGGNGSIQCAELRARGKDEGILSLDLKGCVHSNKPNLSANADVLWNGPVPERVDAELRFLEKWEGKKVDHAPLSYEGVVLGTAFIDEEARPIQLTLKLAQRTVEVSIPALEFELPTEDDTRLVDLAEDPAIHVTDARAPPASNVDAEESSPWSVSVKLGKAVRVTQKGMMRVPVTGSLSLRPDGLLDGSIILPEGGVVPQLGQVFRLKRGSVRFDHQTVKQGVLSIEASTRTADGVVVDLLVSGTMEKPVIRFRSDPPRSEGDIVAMLLGVQGSETGTSTGQPQGQELRGSATALAMNQLVRGSALASLQFGAGQTQKGDSVSTVSVRAGNSPVWIEARTVRTTTQRAATSGAQSSGVIDWRFARGFSLRTQLGNISGLELRWSYRY